ncbi:MNNG and nitrosoguanidine resistance protein [Aspergillus steynii IBT 23096]|uniref:MNNG and nitrosoguanidine resistance protein n=1 Tax=Aspergillus steynii IBT 23096 TaxID=1392250 RepID=A0A2I2FW13_9EURO|nr:MNNG and nitrosoguanidine resistance protein [Aspergillus steynii IBT 23096]PLB44797.1 MNNG and nitrosoguanidine resistance protein [Aspergillus steynii IBT 23096]
MSDTSEKTQVGAAEEGKKIDAPPASVSFFDPALKSVRRTVALQWARMVLILCVFVICVLSLFWSSQFKVQQHLPNLPVWVVDFDGQLDPYQNQDQDPIVGPAVTDMVSSMLNSDSQTVGFAVKSPADFDYDPMAVRQGVYDEHAYAAVIVNANASALLRSAVSNGNASYDPTGAAQFVIISARDENTYMAYITPALDALERAVLADFGPRWVQTVAGESRNISRVPQAINPAIGFTTIDLRPFAPAVATPAVTIGLIYLIIIAFFNFPFLMPVHMQFIKGNHPPLKTGQWLAWRILSNIAAYFFLSLFYSLVSLAFQIPFSNDPAPDTVSAANPNAYGHGSFVVFWMLNWVGMTALGFPCENMAMVLGFPWSSMFLIFWVITNVATGFYPLDLEPGFFRWGYAWPLHRSMSLFPSPLPPRAINANNGKQTVVEALRTILFGKHSRIGLDFGILFTWIAISIAFYPFAAFIMRWKMKRGW